MAIRGENFRGVVCVVCVEKALVSQKGDYPMRRILIFLMAIVAITTTAFAGSHVAFLSSNEPITIVATVEQSPMNVVAKDVSRVATCEVPGLVAIAGAAVFITVASEDAAVTSVIGRDQRGVDSVAAGIVVGSIFSGVNMMAADDHVTPRTEVFASATEIYVVAGKPYGLGKPS